jgi:hypothetical protein
MVRVILPTAGAQPADAADALAVAICHAHCRGTRALVGRASARHEAPVPEVNKDGGPRPALRGRR